MTAEPAHLTPQEVEQPNMTPGVKRGKTDRGNQLMFLRNGKVIAGVIVLAFFTILAIIGPYIAPYDPDALGDDIGQPEFTAQRFLNRLGDSVAAAFFILVAFEFARQ